jgi:hypothetical protein
LLKYFNVHLKEKTEAYKPKATPNKPTSIVPRFRMPRITNGSKKIAVVALNAMQANDIAKQKAPRLLTDAFMKV